LLRNKIYISVIALVEILIGLITLLGLTISVFGIAESKPVNVFIFVLVSACISVILGIGLLKKKIWAHKLLIFFSGYIIITKILIFAGILQLTGELLKVVPPVMQNILSAIYHIFVIVILRKNRFAVSGNEKK